MNFWYTHTIAEIGRGNIDLEAEGTAGDLRVLLVMVGTSTGTERDVDVIDDFTTLDEYDGTSYARQALANTSYDIDDPNFRVELTADPSVWTTLGVGSAQAEAAIIYLHVTDDTDSLPIAYIDEGGFPFDGSGSDITITWNAEGALQLSAA